MTQRKVAKAVRLALITAGAFGAGLYAPASLAQDQDEVTTIVVTGSRIATQTLTSVSPLQIVAQSDIEASGVANIQDLLLANPSFGTPTLSRTNSNFLVASSGVSTIDLRNLGIDRTLVLVDGRRFVAGIPGEAAVDLNAIPAQFLERVEILTGGASAVYGSDAVAGVVNFIYRKKFEGFELDSQIGESAEGDSKDRQVSLTVGTNSADGRGNLMAHIGYTDQGGVFTRDRSFAAIDQISLGALTGNPAELFVVQTPFFSSFAPQGRFFSGPSQFTFNANNQLISGFSTNGSATRAPDGFNRSAQRSIAVPTERYLFATRGSFEFIENHSAFIEGTYSGTQTRSELEPFPLDSGSLYPGAGGQVPIEFETFTTDPLTGVITRTVEVNPLVPAAIVAAAADEDGDGLRDIFFTRRMSEIGNRGNTADRDIYRFVGGFEGMLFSDAWRYDAFYSYGSTKESQVSGGQVNVLNFRNALEVVTDQFNNPVCRDASAREQGCVPANVYGRDALSSAAVNYIKAPGLLGTFTSQKLAGLNVSGKVFDLPAGPLGVAVGAEYREEYSRSEFDPLQQAGLNAGNAIPRQEGDFDVMEGYLETNVPLLAEKPLVQMLNLRGAVRFSDYSTVGETTSWNGGLEWAPIEQLRFRGIRAISVRAPNISELFSPPSQTFPTGLVDPCIGVTATSSGAAAAGCRADPGVAANIAANGAFTLSQADVQGISGFNRGNPALQEENGKSWTFGVVVTDIPGLQNFGLTIDYFDIEIDDAIVATPRQFILDQCYSAGQFCQFIDRRAAAAGPNSAGSIEFIDSAESNSGGFATSGYDITLQYGKSLEDWSMRGRLNARLAYTHVIDGYLIPLPGADFDHFAGESGSSKDRANLTLGYEIGSFDITWRTVYLGEASLDDQFLASFDLPRDAIGIGSYVYNHMQVAWKPGKFEVFAGSNNVFDKAPPPIISGLPFNVTGTETDASTYDAIGRTYYAGVRTKF